MPALVAGAARFFLQESPDFHVSPEGRATAAEGPLDWVFLSLAVVAVIVVIALCIRYFLRPGETSEEHIKRRVLDDEIEVD